MSSYSPKGGRKARVRCVGALYVFDDRPRNSGQANFFLDAARRSVMLQPIAPVPPSLLLLPSGRCP